MSGVRLSLNLSLSVGPAAPSEAVFVNAPTTTFDFVDHATVNRFGIAMIQLHDELWRVTRSTGEVLGYIESFPENGTLRYRAKRMFSSQRRSLPLGEFWSIDDAVDCFRFG
jgi:hypothetical protein